MFIKFSSVIGNTGRLKRVALILASIVVASCTDGSSSSSPPTAPDVPRIGGGPRFAATPEPIAARFSELHYDNVGTDIGERIEIEAPLGLDLSTYNVSLYNGSDGKVYSTRSLLAGGTGAAITTVTTCADRQLVVVAYASNGIQNGSPDGMALVAGSSVIEFLSYEGTFAAIDGAAMGVTSTDIVAVEGSATPVDFSLKRISTGSAFSAESANNFGVCEGVGPPPPTVTSVLVTPTTAIVSQGATQQFVAVARNGADVVSGVSFTWSTSNSGVAAVNPDGVATASATNTGMVTITASVSTGASGTASLEVQGAPPVELANTRFSEIHYDNINEDVNERIEIEGPAGTDVTGWKIILYNGSGGAAYSTTTLGGIIGNQCNGRGTIVATYPQDGIQNGSPDGFALVNAQGDVVEFLSYEGAMTASDGPASGRLSVDIGVSETSVPYGASLSRRENGTWQSAATATFGACNVGGGMSLSNSSISFTGRTVFNDPPLPVGFEDQLFANVRDAIGSAVPTSVVWSSDTPSIATIDSRGVFRAIAAGSATLRATTPDGLLSYTFTLPTSVATASTTAQYQGNTEFGDPVDADASDDFIVRRNEYTSSFSPIRNTPNWVSYNLDASQFGGEDRCDCFTYDPALPANFTRYNTADYTGAAAINGFGIDRGHLARSADRTSASLDNAHTYYFSNIIPQASEVNQGPWAIMENFLGDAARQQNREVYIIAGVAGSRGTVKNEGVITIPAFVWKVAVLLPRNEGLANVVTGAEPEIIAVVIPNSRDGLNADWTTYRTTVDSVEALSGYDLLSLLPDAIETQLESGNRFPVARITGATGGFEGSALMFSASTSTDPDVGDALLYRWSFGDGMTSTSVSPTHVFSNNGSYAVTLTVTDQEGAANSATSTITVLNVAPAVTSVSSTTFSAGSASSVRFSFVDANPKDAPFTITIDWGDNTPATRFLSLVLPAVPFGRTHTYAMSGDYTITIRVADRDGGIGVSTLRVSVQP